MNRIAAEDVYGCYSKSRRIALQVPVLDSHVFSIRCVSVGWGNRWFLGWLQAMGGSKQLLYESLSLKLTFMTVLHADITISNHIMQQGALER